MFIYPKSYDVIVVGGGHAGTEAALAAARIGCQTLLLTINLDTIGQMSCNPAIGGVAKGHLVREVDALGGEMGRNTDMTGIQFRMLNTRKGPSVRAPRAQCDKKAYQFRLKWVCERQANLDCKEGQTVRLIVKGGQVYAVETNLDVQYRGKTVVVTTGTFLRGLLHVGGNQRSGGRAGEQAAVGLSSSLKDLGIELGRLKTGTPPRLVRSSIDFSRMEPQPGDEPPPFFSYWKDDLWSADLFHVEQSRVGSEAPTATPSGPRQTPRLSVGIPGLERVGVYPPNSILARCGTQTACYITFTTPRTAEIIRTNLHRSPMYSGVIEGVGPRYCPSIEDKIVRFSEKERHQIFLEPEGIATDEIYVNGCSTCLPYEVQVELVRTIIGCERAEIVRPAYAVEYDFADPTQLHPSLETKVCPGLFLAGQINGTSGYEEAAAQGIMAGINAALQVLGKEPIVLRRDQAYIGVLIDDLTTKGTSEPYRMFTSRAEYRLTLRQDNADIRLGDIGFAVGLLSHQNHERLARKRATIHAELERLRATYFGADSLEQILRRPEQLYRDLPSGDPALEPDLVAQIESIVKYAGYIERQNLAVDRFKVLEDKRIPEWVDYHAVPSLRIEARQKLSRIKPATIGQASRISGVSPSDVSILLVHLKRAAELGRPSRE